MAQGANELTLTKPLIYWWARQGLATPVKIKHLQFSETIGPSDVSPCLSQQIVSLDTSSKPDFEALEAFCLTAAGSGSGDIHA